MGNNQTAKPKKKGLFDGLFDKLDRNLEKKSKEDCCCCSGGKCSK